MATDLAIERPVVPGAPSTPAAPVSLAERAAVDDVRFILATFVDLNGKPCSKLVPVEAADQLQAEGVGFAGYAAGATGQVPSDPDLMAVPDLASYASLPFVRPGLAMVQCDPHVEGEPWPFAPRVMLRRMIERAARRSVELWTGAELEYFLVARDAEGRVRVADELDRAAQPCYDARGVTRMYEHLAAVSGAMNDLGWGNYANDHEDGNGQFEQNFGFADALTTADRVITARYVIQMLAEQRGMAATFMPKPFTDRTGNGMHLHLSLWRDGSPLFPDAGDVRGLGLSPMAYGFLGGVLDHAAGLSALLQPTVNSYKRTGATTTNSGATWAPRRASYGGNDRTHLVRVPDGNRIELRGGDGAANPYLASAAVLAAGLDGMAREVDPGNPCPAGTHADGAAELPRTLLEAVAALDADPVLRDALDCADGASRVGAYFAHLKREEFYAYHSQVTTWELDRYLSA